MCRTIDYAGVVVVVLPEYSIAGSSVMSKSPEMFSNTRLLDGHSTMTVYVMELSVCCRV